MRRKHHRRYQGRFTRLASLARFVTAGSRRAAAGLLAFAALFLIMPMPAQAQGNAQSATYRVTFEGQFTASALASGVSVPAGERFTTLIGGVHNDSVTFWSSGGTASAGIESMAEAGGTSALKSEIDAAMLNALAVIEQSIASGGTATATVDITLTTDHPLVTLTSRVAPSPDWFVGVSGLSLRNAADDGWQPSLTVELFPYDAGTEEGTEFSLNNAATSPQGTIASIKGTGKFSNEPIATLTFLRRTPVITSPSMFAVDENGTAVATLSATDTETDSDQLTWSIPLGEMGGPDAARFALSGAGVLTFLTAPDYENPADADRDNVYAVTVQVSDGAETGTQDLAVALENVIELTAIDGPNAVSYPENRAIRAATYIASSEADRAGVTWALTGADDAKFSIDDPGGALRFDLDPVSKNLFAQPPDYEAPSDADADNDYAVTLQASDGVTTSTLAVTVTVSDEDEPGTLQLSATRPRMETELIGTLADPDVVNGAPAYVWERSAGRNAWAVIDGADSNSYRPTAADAGEFLRVTATYADRHGDDRTAQAVTTEVVTAGLLSGLRVTTNDSMAHAARAMKPGTFDPATLHYAIGCADDDTMMLTLSASDAAARLSVDGEQTVNRNATVAVPVSGESDVRIEVTDGTGARTTYTVHCLPEDFPEITARKNPNADGVIEELIIVPHGGLLILDNNGVPRFRRFSDRARRGGFLQFERVGENLDYRYVYSDVAPSNWYGIVVLDEHFEEVDRATTVTPLAGFDSHDHRMLPNGNYLLMSYEWATRDFSHLPFNDANGNPYASSLVRDSAIQIVTPLGQALFTWNSWGKMPLEDCAQHRFPDGYAHINSLQMVDGYIVASMRGCSKVLVLDPDHAQDHKVVWRLGHSNLSDAQWAASDFGPAPLDIVGDPEGEFCGQHAAQIRPNGNLLLYDNGAPCVVSPWTREVLGRESYVYSRAVEYALDMGNNEAVFVRDHSLRGARNRLGYASGNVSVLANGDWLISWGKPALPGDPWGFGPPYSPDEAVTQVDPDTGEEKFFLSAPDGTAQARIKALPMPPEALANEPVPLSARIVESADSHTGTTDRPKVVVAFNQPVVDFTAATTSVSIQGATIDGVSAHTMPGEPANAYVVTLTPAGASDITFGLVADQLCADGGICTAGETLLSEVPASHVIRGDGGGPGGPGGGGGGPPPPGDDDEDDGGAGGGGQPPPSGPPGADFTLTAECAGELCRARTDVPVTFEDTSTGRVQSRRWDFGDGTASRDRRIDHAWSSPGFYEVTLSVSDGTTASTARQVFLVEASDPAGTCVPGVETLCLQDSRFEVGVDWWTANGESGAASVVHSGTNDSGMFWFFSRDNWEILIKVLDGCARNGHVWVFGASTTDLGYVIRVTDTVTGAVREYRNEPGIPAAAITGTAAFPEGCKSAARESRQASAPG